ncbi:MAG: AmmeMemoRadiSam system protein B [Chromatiales bacterium]
MESRTPMRRLIPLLCLPALFLSPLVAPAGPEATRPPAKAGSWYPAEPSRLAALIDRLLTQAPVTELQENSAIRALIVPHAAYRYSGATAAIAYRALQGRSYRRVVLLGPAHHSIGESGLSVLDVQAYDTPLGAVPLDRTAIAGLRNNPLVQQRPTWHRDEHSLEIQLPFLQRVLTPGWELLPILVGNLQDDEYAQAAQALKPLIDDQTLLVISSDFTHYGAAFGYLPFPADRRIAQRLQELDLGAFEQLAAKDPEGFLDYRQRTGITICGYQPLTLLLHLLPADARLELLQYDTSGAMTGDYRQSVSYIAALITETLPPQQTQAVSSEALTEEQLQILYEIAQLTIRAQVARDPIAAEALQTRLDSIPEQLTGNGAAFVTLWEQDQLRGCVGTSLAWEPLYRSVMRGAEGAALHDPRFLPVAPQELTDLQLEISVLSEPQPIASPDECVPGKHGIVLTQQDHQAVYLPEVAPHMGWDCPETLRRLSLKAGLPEDAWRNGAELKVFTSRKFAPSP